MLSRPLEARGIPMNARLQRWLGRLTEPYVLYPVFALLLLGILWGTTLNLIGQEFAAARRAAAVSTHELTETYEAQMVRALREIDLTLKAVKLAYEHDPGGDVLGDMKARELLPPDLLFAVSIADERGRIIASTRPSEMADVAGRDFFEAQREHDVGLAVGKPSGDAAGGEAKLQFSRRMQTPQGGFAGVAILAVDAAYFVSGYEPSKLGEQGVLGVLDPQGVFLVRRTGETVSSGDHAGAAMQQADEALEPDQTAIVTSPWDDVRRYTSVRQLYDFPLAVIVGLSEAEQLAPVEKNRRIDLAWATAGSVLVLLFIAMLGRISLQLVRSRQRMVAEQLAHAKQVEYLAYHDGLTGLPNRSLFSKMLSQGIAHARRYNRQLAVLFLDLDRFKHINDTLGHEAGDELLVTVATRLRACLRENDCVARLGGDEFVVLLPELEHEKHLSTVAQKILAAVAKPFILLGQEFRVTASVGISIYPQDGSDEQTLKKNADIAMYQAKAEGKNNFQFYSEKLNTDSLERLTLESGLRHALERNEFELHYQAKRDVQAGNITGMEVLLRWNHPDLGLVAPMQFIPVAEETGLIVAIGNWVLRTACRQNVAWQAQGLPRLIIAVNLTARQFNDENLLRDIDSILGETGMDARLLELEITEGMLMHNIERTLSTLAALKQRGIRLAIDDFGLGYSSLSTLQQFPLDTIKIDRSFIRDVTHVAEDRALAEAIITMGRSLSMTVVAQGVETKEQADFLRQHDCDELQGFYFNRPVPADLFAELVRSQPAASVLPHPTLKKQG
jgi:diguanylate cyclase (GGDEF)-like protein